MIETKEIINWLGGPVSHVHLRNEDQPAVFDIGEKHQFTTEAAVYYLENLTKNPDTRITDTNHALLDFDIENIPKPEGLTDEQWKSFTIDLASQSVSEKLKALRQNPESSRIIAGIEVDIIGENGELSLDDGCLSGLDLVIASFHSFVREFFTGEKYYTKQYLMNAYMGAVLNPHVDALGHPTKLSSRVADTIFVEDYLLLLDLMAQRKVAMEINLFEDLESQENSLTLNVVSEAVRRGVPLILSSDFHHFEESDFAKDTNVYPGVVNKHNFEEVFRNNQDFHFRLFRRLAKNINTLNKIGVTPELIVNSSNENFDRWQNEKRVVA